MTKATDEWSALEAQDAMGDIYEKLARVGKEHALFQAALYILLADCELVVRPGDGGSVEYRNTEDGGILVRRARPTPAPTD